MLRISALQFVVIFYSPRKKISVSKEMVIAQVY